MATPRIPNQRNQYNKLNERLARYVLAVQSIYDDLNAQAAKAALSTNYNGEQPFRFSDYPQLRHKVEQLQTDFVTDLGALIMRGTSEEWKQSNLLQDMIADKVIKAYTGEKNREKHTQYYQTNSPQLKAFQQRKDRGMNLSAKLWEQSEEYKTELESALSLAIERGTDAITLSKQVSKYLADFDSLKADYKEKFGTATDIHDCEYRSIRLARSEINMAYRTAEQARWQQFDFVVGYEIKLSGSHPKEDICDRLAGKYPKDFVWTGWHPNDLCYCIPLLKTEEEFFDDMYSEERVQMNIESGGEYAEETKNKLEKLCEEYCVRVKVKYRMNAEEGEGEIKRPHAAAATITEIYFYDNFSLSKYAYHTGNKRESVIAHEFGHWLCQEPKIRKTMPSYEKWRKSVTFVNGYPEEKIKEQYERLKKQYEFINPALDKRGLRPHQPDGLFEALVEIKEQLKKERGMNPSLYSMQNINEWIAESFAMGTLEPGKNKYADRVVDTIRKYYANRQVDAISSLKPQNQVIDVPIEFKKYIYDNRDKIAAANKANTLPYFIRDNYEYAQSIIQHGIQVNNEASEFVMSDKMAQNLLKKGWGEIDVSGYNSSNLRGFDIVSFSEEADEWLKVVGSKSAHREVNIRRDKNVLVYAAADEIENGRQIAHLELETYLRHNERYFTIKDVWLADGLQGQRLADPLVLSVFQKMQAASVEFCEIDTVGVGGYFWAKAGMKCEISDFEVLFESLKNKAQTDSQKKTLDIIRRIADVIRKGDYVPMDTIAAIDGAKELLMNTSWKGFFDLQNEKQMQTLTAYLTRK